MRRSRTAFAFILAASLLTLPAIASKTRHVAPSVSNARSAHKAAASGKTSASGRSRRSSRVKTLPKKSHKLHGQQAIASERVTEIQQALIREHYLNGEANGEWDSTTQSAMQKFQADQGWQTRLMPDSRALKKLGLGPDYSTAINATGSSFSAPAPVNSIPSEQASGFAAAAGVN